jgi:hypothetical protein
MVDWLSRQFGKSIQVTTPTLPSPFPEGGIYDKGEGRVGKAIKPFNYSTTQPFNQI